MHLCFNLDLLVLTLTTVFISTSMLISLLVPLTITTGILQWAKSFTCSMATWGPVDQLPFFSSLTLSGPVPSWPYRANQVPLSIGAFKVCGQLAGIWACSNRTRLRDHRSKMM